MPTYEYLCLACDKHFEAVQRITEDAIKTCPSCGEDKAKRQISQTAFHLKGSGWYKTDYASSGSSGDGSKDSSKDSSSSDTKPESKASETKTAKSDKSESVKTKDASSKPAASPKKKES